MEQNTQPTVTELSTQEFIQTQVVKFKTVITDEIINAKKDELLALKINGLDDKEGYKIVQEKLNKLVKVRTGIESKRKELLLISKTYDAAVNKEAKRLTELAAPIELHLKTQKSQIDGERERLEAIERQRIENEKRAAVERFNSRTQQLFDLGMMFNGVGYILDGRHYRLGVHEITNESINSLDDINFAQHVNIVSELKRLIDAEYLKNNPPIQEVSIEVIEPQPPKVDLFTIPMNGNGGSGGSVRVGSGNLPGTGFSYSPQYINGFNAGLQSIVDLLSGEEKFTRPQLIEKINSFIKFA